MCFLLPPHIISQIKPRAVLLENVQGFAAAKLEEYRDGLHERFSKLGHDSDWRVLQASDFWCFATPDWIWVLTVWDSLIARPMSRFQSIERRV
ncbi:MAG: DNA cytosine methyltransferase [Verrucomicrobiales bacterium]|nr:DNA cytosine methyltransferase [Verrucomicrobiales bacterium]MBP9224508.1 DNA cytosine methyltransferase [Verrucomicrobiales bacterium]